ncbi:hypothetical protein QSA_2973 [Clostridioides difficile P21]|nr:hypothetical protein QCQ_3096 [Clostridioides difficile CD49]EQF96966.1 hypothetical protein QGY_2968 [Clostridioides difficile 840]EQG32369.1 hypothetical protein QIO_3135 [Clostridioides difficile DA00129]EQH02920.1 hypothetical protein QKO_3001 [Clostridioides difficile DA00195]EQH46543.1 hypothetical protein QME_2877 [Clostridioides difficile DA00246]EQI54744.1 hypothetical protein QQ3_3034 [Clostridioides difficile Y266]EQI56481.1 hypothetical protein QQ9_2975 [Clostridioides difficil
MLYPICINEVPIIGSDSLSNFSVILPSVKLSLSFIFHLFYIKFICLYS